MFWTGFYKRAEALTGGEGFSGAGKGNLPTGYSEQGRLSGTASGGEDTKTDKTLLDRQRNPKDFGVGNHGEDGPADTNPHIVY
jgi:hypothetical protein